MQLEPIFKHVCWAPGLRKPFQPSESEKSHFYRSYDHKLTFTRITWSTITPSNDQIQNFDVVFRYQRPKGPIYRPLSFSCQGPFKEEVRVEIQTLTIDSNDRSYTTGLASARSKRSTCMQRRSETPQECRFWEKKKRRKKMIRQTG